MCTLISHIFPRWCLLQAVMMFRNRMICPKLSTTTCHLVVQWLKRSILRSWVQLLGAWGKSMMGQVRMTVLWGWGEVTVSYWMDDPSHFTVVLTKVHRLPLQRNEGIVKNVRLFIFKYKICLRFMSPYYSKDILSILVKIINSSGILFCEKHRTLST